MRRLVWTAVIAVVVTWVGTAAFGARLQPVGRAQMEVTEGTITVGRDGTMSVDSPKMRAVAPDFGIPIAELRFVYLGPTAVQEPLESGDVRQQIGLKLRAQDPCNLLYVMWRLDPVSEIVVSVKRNPGHHHSAECGNHGYHTIATVPMPAVEAGRRHAMRADLSGTRLTVRVDGRSVWTGEVQAPPVGPVGVRSDNGRFQFSLSGRD